MRSAEAAALLLGDRAAGTLSFAVTEQQGLNLPMVPLLSVSANSLTAGQCMLGLPLRCSATPTPSADGMARGDSSIDVLSGKGAALSWAGAWCMQ